MTMGLSDTLDPLSICGTSDNRWYSYYRNVCRMLVKKGNSTYICTGWLVSTWRGGHVTAGHCLSGATGVTSQYNVPRSNSNGTRRNPPAADQYSWLSYTRRYRNGGVGNDWGVYRTSGNPYTRQRTRFTLKSPVRGRYVRRSGFGTASGAKKYSQKTHGGGISSVRWNYISYSTIDSTGGDSGGPVFEGSTQAVGIHTHGGCSSTGGSNKATNTNLYAFRQAYYTVR